MFKKIFGIFFVVLVLATPTTNTFAAAESKSFKETISEKIKDPKKFVAEYAVLFGLLRTVAHIPYIVCMDHEDTNIIGLTTGIANLATDAKIGCELLTTRETNLLKDLVYPNRIPKVSAYTLAVLYDVIRIVDAENVAFKNKYGNAKKKLRMFKIAQALQVAIEGTLRVLSYVSSVQTPSNQNMAFWLLELADFIEIWRLLSRYKTFFDISGVQANINFFAHKPVEEDEEYDEEVATKDTSADQTTTKSIDELSDDSYEECCINVKEILASAQELEKELEHEIFNSYQHEEEPEEANELAHKI
ncbi:hypothetical protein IPF37_04220 [bacterium]|nr:MAG: hypothetical protein IPF37_04220 [bacterium]